MMLSMVRCLSLELVVLRLLGLVLFVWPVLLIWPLWLLLFVGPLWPGLFISLDELALSDVDVGPAAWLLADAGVWVVTEAAVQPVVGCRLKGSVGLHGGLLPDLDGEGGPDESFTLVLPEFEHNRVELSLPDEHGEDVLFVLVLALQRVALLVQLP